MESVAQRQRSTWEHAHGKKAEHTEPMGTWETNQQQQTHQVWGAGSQKLPTTAEEGAPVHPMRGFRGVSDSSG